VEVGAEDAPPDAATPPESPQDQTQADGADGGNARTAGHKNGRLLVDEIRQMQDYRYMTASQALHHLFDGEMCYFMHNVSIA
jgi:hypothetical protein